MWDSGLIQEVFNWVSRPAQLVRREPRCLSHPFFNWLIILHYCKADRIGLHMRWDHRLLIGWRRNRPNRAVSWSTWEPQPKPSVRPSQTSQIWMARCVNRKEDIVPSNNGHCSRNRATIGCSRCVEHCWISLSSDIEAKSLVAPGLRAQLLKNTGECLQFLPYRNNSPYILNKSQQEQQHLLRYRWLPLLIQKPDGCLLGG